MRDANVFNLKRALPRMSWSPRNLYNLWRRSLGKKASETDYTRTTKTLFQQRWAAKQLVRAYHGDYINEKIFKRWYLPATLPDVRPRGPLDDSLLLNKWANRNDVLERERKRKEEEEMKGLPPVGSLMFSEIERRIDVVIFRSCFAHSVYEARRLVVHGDVLLNGKKHQDANTRLAPGDMVSVNPKAIRFIQPKAEDTVENAADHESGVTTAEDSPVAASDVETQSQPNSPAAAPSPKPKTKRKPESDLTSFHLPDYASPFIFVPAYLEASFSTCSTIYLRHPTARPGYSEIPTPYDADGEIVRLAWEWYSKVRPRMRSKSQLARMPESRQ